MAGKTYVVIIEGWFDSESSSNEVRDERELLDTGGGSGGGQDNYFNIVILSK